MFSLPGIISLTFFFYIRPQEFITSLQQLPLLYLLTALAFFGMVIDLKLRLVRPEPTPQLPWVVLFFAWTGLSALLKHPEPLHALVALAILMTWYLVLSHGIQSFRALGLLVGVVVVLSVFLAGVGAHQHFAAKGCVFIDPNLSGGSMIAGGIPDGRSCKVATDCRGEGSEPGREYTCENIGIFGTTTIAGRVRYRGTMHDPNELAVVISIAAPFLIGFVSNRRTKLRWLLALLSAGLIILCVIYTESRGGLLALAAGIGVYLLRYSPIAGTAGGAAALALLMAITVHRRHDASDSSKERMGCWWEGMDMFRYNPLMGVGYDQFTEHHYLTAHNSFVLTSAELGIVGMFLWIAVLYTSFKIPLVAYWRHPDRPRVRRWAMALLASFTSMMVGAFFLSLSYSYMLWCYIALCGAFYRALRQHDPDWKMPFGLADAAAVGTLTVGSIGGLYVLTHYIAPPT